MTQLYTVKMTTKCMCSKFDEKGRKIGEDVIEIPQTHYDLPLSTAKMYQTKNPDGNVQIIAQEPLGSSKQTFTRKRNTAVEAEPKKRRQAAPVTSGTTKNDAARTGDMAAAING